MMAALAAASVLVATASQAAVIDFDALSGNNGDVFTGPYAEDGYSVAVVGGQVFEGQVFGNPQPSLVVGSVFGGGDNGAIEATGGLFTLASFDLSAQNGDGNYLIEGFLGASNIYSFGGSTGFGFTTIGGNSSVVDRVRFSLNATGTSINIDNIVLNASAVPEPATWAFMIAGFGMVGWSMRRANIKTRLAIA
jgi:hypothetical protein